MQMNKLSRQEHYVTSGIGLLEARLDVDIPRTARIKMAQRGHRGFCNE